MAGSWTTISDANRQAGIFQKDRFFRVISATFTADAAAGTVPNLTIPKAWGYIVKLVTKPGAVQPTTLYDITVEDENGIDVLAGAGQNRSATVGEQAAPVISGAATPVPISGDLTVKVTNNSVNSATAKVELWLAE